MHGLYLTEIQRLLLEEVWPGALLTIRPANGHSGGVAVSCHAPIRRLVLVDRIVVAQCVYK